MQKALHHIATLTALVLVTSISGCTKPVADKATNNDQQIASQDSTSSAVPEKDAATEPNALPDKDANAKLVCERFLALLARGERNLAEQLLSRRAFKTTVDAGLELEPLGNEDSKVTVGDAVYATSEAKVAQVPCTVTEKDGTQQNLQWMMRRGESGWRIAGLVMESGGSTEFLSLESRADVASIVKSRGGDSAPASSSVGLVSHESEIKNDSDEGEKTQEKLDSGS